MEDWMLYTIAAAAAALVLMLLVVAIVRSSRTKKRQKLRTEFKNEYDVAADGHSAKEAARELEQRKTRVEGYKLRDLTPDESRNFAGRWRTIKAEFVSHPSDAVVRADELLAGVMLARGYDVSMGENDRAVDLSVGHPDEATAYREITAIAAANARGEASTEDLRHAMVGYERVVESMLGNRVPA